MYRTITTTLTTNNRNSLSSESYWFSCVSLSYKNQSKLSKFYYSFAKMLTNKELQTQYFCSVKSGRSRGVQGSSVNALA